MPQCDANDNTQETTGTELKDKARVPDGKGSMEQCRVVSAKNLKNSYFRVSIHDSIFLSRRLQPKHVIRPAATYPNLCTRSVCTYVFCLSNLSDGSIIR